MFDNQPVASGSRQQKTHEDVSMYSENDLAPADKEYQPSGK